MHILIPCLFANKVSAALSEFIFTGYEPETAPFKGKSERLEEEQEDDKAFIKGLHAYLAQVWQRLPTDNQSTNLLTATGETEWFLYPVLDHCQRTGRKIKALSAEERYRIRQELSVPALKTLNTWLETNAGKVAKGTLTRTAMDYTLN